MTAHFRRCLTEDDYVQFTRFFIENRLDFSATFTLNNTLLHILQTIRDSQIILVVDERDKAVGWAHYQYFTAAYQLDPHGELAFINSTILAKEYRRSGRLFLNGFRYLAKQIGEENPHVNQVQFCAQSENAYLNRLYAKFANVIGQREGDHGLENIYASEYNQLLSYLSIN